MKPILILIGKLAAFLAAAYALQHYDLVAEYWYVGPAFGTVVLVWHARTIRDLVSAPSLGFLGASTLIYAVVAWIIMESDSVIPEIPEVFDAGFLGVMIGTALLPVAHGALLGASWGRVKIAIPCLYLTWYALALSGLFDLDITLINSMSVWQGLYLLFMFSPKPGFLERK
jgi:hypothetical protein